MAKEFTDANFATEVIASDKLVLVDFWAPWCGPCKMIGPALEEIAAENQGRAPINRMKTSRSA